MTETRATVLGILVPVGLVAVVVSGGLAWFAAGRGPPPVAAHRARGVRGRRDRPGHPRPGTGHPRRGRHAGRHAQRDARPVARRDRTRAPLHRRRQPRAAHPARHPPRRGRAAPASTSTVGRGQRLDSALEEADRLRDLIDDLLVLARADADALDDQLDVDLGDLARATVARFEVLADRGEVVVTATGDARVTGDPRGLERAVSNLVDNAVRHTPSGGEVAIAVRATADGAEVRVTDTGPGVPDEVLPSCSTASRDPTRPARAAVPGWGWRSWPRSCTGTAAPSPRGTAIGTTVVAVASRSRCRCRAGPAGTRRSRSRVVGARSSSRDRSDRRADVLGGSIALGVVVLLAVVGVVLYNRLVAAQGPGRRGVGPGRHRAAAPPRPHPEPRGVRRRRTPRTNVVCWTP